MQQVRYTYRNSIRGITTLLLFLLAMHFSGLQGLAESTANNLETGSVEVATTGEGAFISSARPEVNSELLQGYTISLQEKAHNTISSLLFLCEEESGEFDKKRMLQFPYGILAFLTNSSACQGFPNTTSALDFIQTFANTHLLTVVLLH